MKLSHKTAIYGGLLLLLLVLVPYAKGAAGGILYTGCFILCAAGTAYAYRWLAKLEKGIGMLQDHDAFKEYWEAAGDKTLRSLAEGMAAQHDAVKDRYRAKVMDRQSTIDSLQSQINPHFLYNTLECIRSEAVVLHCGSIANMAKSLAAFFRYSISRKENIVTIRDELNNVKNYFLIQNYRFEDKFILQVAAEDEDDAYDCLIPKMTIQPIVENSIFHGLETKAGECCVKIDIKTTEDKVILTISDNGTGMDEDTLQSLRERIEKGGGAESSAHGNGIALYNVNRRIRLTFGNDYGLNLYSAPGEGTDVEIIMPIVTEQDGPGKERGMR